MEYHDEVMRACTWIEAKLTPIHICQMLVLIHLLAFTKTVS